ncbi:MAG: NUDIX hydrolase [Bacteroidales bacterium]
MSYTYEYPRPMVTVDAIVFRKKENGMQVLLIKRKNDPYKGIWALPGGFVDMDETLEEAVVRELKEETNVRFDNLTQLHAFSAVDRDPRGRNIGVMFYGIIPHEKSFAKAGDDAQEAEWFFVNALPPLAFDHKKAIEMAIKKIPD